MSLPTFHMSRYYGIPSDRISRWHLVEHSPSILNAPTFCIHVNQAMAHKDIRITTTLNELLMSRITKVVVFEACKFVCQAFQYEGEAIKQLNFFKYLGVELHGTKGMQGAIQQLTMSGKKRVFALRRRCVELRISDPTLQC